MTNQLALLPPERRDGPQRPRRGGRAGAPSRHLRAAPQPTASRHPWSIDERTREVGRAGLAAARDALRQARARVALSTEQAADAA